MPIQDHLSSSIDRRDQEPNKQLAVRIATGEYQVKELIDFLKTQPKRQFQQDAILTLAYTAEKNATLVAPYGEFLSRQLDSKFNRVVWGSMIALSHLTKVIPELLFHSLSVILQTMETSTVVARDHGFKILIGLYTLDEYQDQVTPLIAEQIQIAPDNQFGQYTERWMEVIIPKHRNQLIAIMEQKRQELTNAIHLKRLDKNLRKLIQS